MVLQATLQHVVLTYDPINGRQIYVNGALVASGDPQKGGDISAWDDTFAIVLGNEVSGTRPWVGEIRLVGVYDRALTPAQITLNYNAGVGERYFVLFSIANLINTPNAYVMFTVSEYDSYSYLFDKPTFIMLGSGTPPTFELKGMRLGINGQQAPVGQAYIPLDVTVSSTGYTQSGGLPLTRIGTVIPLQNGPGYDMFFLTFEKLGSLTNVQTDPVPIAPTPVDLPLPSDIGVKTYERLSATYSTVTGIPRSNAAVSTLFQNLQQSLPATQDFQAFVASHQVSIAQLSMQYCNSLVSDPVKSAAYFPGFNFSAPPNTAFATAAQKNLVIQPLLAHVLGTQPLATNPSTAAVSTELSNLIDLLVASPCTQNCTNRTQMIVTAACAAITGSAATLVE
jgi:hypothetical protein